MRDSERKKFDKLYSAHHQMVRGLLYHMIPSNHLEDLVQETFLRIWKGLPQFGFLSSEKTWIYRVTLNTAIDHLRKLGNTPLPSELNEEVLSVDSWSSEQTSSEASQKIQRALQAIDEKHRAVLILYYFEDQDLRQIAQILQIPVGTVKSRLSVAREKMKELLNQKGDFDEVPRQKAR